MIIIKVNLISKVMVKIQIGLLITITFCVIEMLRMWKSPVNHRTIESALTRVYINRHSLWTPAILSFAVLARYWFSIEILALPYTILQTLCQRNCGFFSAITVNKDLVAFNACLSSRIIKVFIKIFDNRAEFFEIWVIEYLK